jgi:hypothetical protein
MWAEGGVSQGSVLHFCVAFILEASLFSVREAAAGHMELCILSARPMPVRCTVPPVCATRVS